MAWNAKQKAFIYTNTAQADYDRNQQLDQLRGEVQSLANRTHNYGSYNRDAFNEGYGGIYRSNQIRMKQIMDAALAMRSRGRRKPNYPTPSGVNINAVASSPSIYGQTSSGAPVVGSVIPHEAAAAYTGTSLHSASPASSPDPYEWWKRNH